MQSSVQIPGRAAPGPAVAAAGTHPRLTIALHWTSAAIVLLAFGVVWSRELFDDETPRRLLMTVHQTSGLLALALLLARLGARFARPTEAMVPPLPRLLRWAGWAGHAALYALLLAMPLLGWALANAHGHPVGLPGLLSLPALVGPDPDLAETIETWHKGLAWVFLATIASHVGAALYHHFIRRDHVLAAMWPARRRASARRPRGFGPQSFPISESFR